MRCPDLVELPPPPKEKRGWPWSIESPQIIAGQSNGSMMPKISVVTPSFNQAEFIEETIRSVLLQGYPNIEYIIIDGGSNDGSVEIIEKYRPWLYYWVSEPDRGQSNAINKGWRKANGELLAWINSDDFYEPGAFSGIVKCFQKNINVDMVYGDCNIVDKNSKYIGDCPKMSFKFEKLIRNKWFISQPATFIKRKAINVAGQVNEELHLVMDWEYFIRIALNDQQIRYCPWPTSNFRIYEAAKTSSNKVQSGEEKIAVLKYLFHRSRFKEKIRMYKKKAFSDVYNWASTMNSENEFMGKALEYFLKSIWYQPKQLLYKKTINRIIFYFRKYLYYQNKN